ncbi:hypothetical protein CPB85DRAFT_1335999 [Mucidula mucida]|nr:hypothetical protein CPB85DRAFT_1335999 [Mucidula mucida]
MIWCRVCSLAVGLPQNFEKVRLNITAQTSSHQPAMRTSLGRLALVRSGKIDENVYILRMT